MSLFRSRLRLLAAVLAMLLVAACGSDGDVASVEGGDTLTTDEVEALLDIDGDAASVGQETLSGAELASLLGQNQPGAGVIERTAAAGVITDWVRNELFYAFAAEAGITDVQPYIDEAQRQFDEFVAANPGADVPPVGSAAADELVRSVALGPLLTDYMLDTEGFELLCSSHILLDTEADALAVIDRLEAGEDFTAVAVEVSTDPSAQGNGGNLGCVDPAGFVVEFVDGAAALGGPGLTPPVESQFGWHVIDVRSFDSAPVGDPVQIQDAVLASSAFALVQQDVTQREVTVDPRYGEWDQASASVVPATG